MNCYGDCGSDGSSGHGVCHFPSGNSADEEQPHLTVENSMLSVVNHNLITNGDELAAS